MLNLIELQVFLIAAETENFSETGRRLNLSQPAVSMQIQSLEAQLGIQLFHRSGRHISLTEAGAALMPLSRDLLNHAIQVEETIHSLQGQVVGLLRLGCSTTLGKYILPRLIARLHERHPHVQVVCSVTNRSHALNMLLGGEAQIAITSLCEPYKDIEYRPFLVDPVVLIVPASHPWAAGSRVIQPAALTQATFIMREEGAGTQAALKQGLAWHGLSVDDLPTVMVLGNSEAIRMSVQEGLGAAFVSGMVASEGCRSGGTVPIRVEGMELNQTLYLARHTRRPATSAQTAFWDFAFSPENEDVRMLPQWAPDLEQPPA